MNKKGDNFTVSLY